MNAPAENVPQHSEIQRGDGLEKGNIMKFRSRPISLIAVAMFTGLTIPVAVSAQKGREGRSPSITVFDAPGAVAPPGSYLGTIGQGINAQGTVTGYFTDANVVVHGFVRDADGQFTVFDAPGSGTVPGSQQGTYAIDINVEGEVTGYVFDDNYLVHGFVRDRSGQIASFDAPGAGTDGSQFQGTAPEAINASGEIAGYYQDAANAFHGFVRARNGTVTTFDAPGAGTGPYQGTIVNNNGMISPEGSIAGYFYDANYVPHGYVRTADGKITTFDGPGAGTDGHGQGTYDGGINPEGEISGSVIDGNNVRRAFIRARDGSFTTFDAPGAGSDFHEGTYAHQINASGLVAGTSLDSSVVFHGYVRTARGAFTVFDAPGAGATPDSGQGTVTQGLNGLGAVAGYVLDENYVFHGFVRSPQP
jgi:hypothetical protein